MPLTTSRWPLLTSSERTPDETARWWDECFYLHEAISRLLGQPHWRLLVGGAGSGKSVALEAVARKMEGRALILHYSASQWPHSTQSLVRGGNHLSQIMALAAQLLRRELTAHPEGVASLSSTQHAFLRLLIERYADSRAYARWLDGLPAEIAETLQTVEFIKDLYLSDTAPRDVEGKIEELIGVVRRLRFEELLLLADIPGSLNQAALHDLDDLFEWLEPMHHRGLTLVAAVDARTDQKRNLVAKARGRVNRVTIRWERDQAREIAVRHLRTATTLTTLEQLVTPELLAKLEETLEEEYGEPAPGAWTALLRILLENAQIQAVPLTAALFPDVKREFFRRCLPLFLDPDETHRGVWRGPRFIPLTEQPYNFLRVLWKYKGDPVDREAFQSLAYSKEYVHTLAGRVRKAIEPTIELATKDKDRFVYIHERRGEGYWLENFVS